MYVDLWNRPLFPPAGSGSSEINIHTYSTMEKIHEIKESILLHDILMIESIQLKSKQLGYSKLVI